MLGKYKHRVDYDNPPELNASYGELKIIGKAMPRIVRIKRPGDEVGYQTRWSVQCECSCGNRTIMQVENITQGNATRCIVCHDRDSMARCLYGNLGGRPGKKYTIWGETKTIPQWIEDDRCLLKSQHALRVRLMQCKQTAEGYANAITRPPNSIVEQYLENIERWLARSKSRSI